MDLFKKLATVSSCLLFLAACGVEDMIEKGGDEEENDSGTPMLFTKNVGFQSDFEYSRFDIFSNQQHYEDFIETLPTLSISAPTYDDSTEVMTALTAVDAICIAYPYIESVKEFESVIVIHLSHKLESDPGLCDPQPGPASYEMYFISVAKSDKAIKLVRSSGL